MPATTDTTDVVSMDTDTQATVTSSALANLSTYLSSPSFIQTLLTASPSTPLPPPLLAALSHLHAAKTGEELYTDCDVEGVWGQIEANNGELKLVNKGVKRLEDVVVVEGDDDESSNPDDDDLASSEEESDADENDKSDAQRIRERMRRLEEEDGEMSEGFSDEEDLVDENDEDDLVDDGDDDDENDLAVESDGDSDDSSSDESNGDPMGAPMRDGFFDMDELEKWADDEEEMVMGLDDMYEKIEKKSKKTKSSSKGKKGKKEKASTYGGEESGSDTESGEEMVDEDFDESRKVRDDDEINVLASMYGEDGGSDEEEVTAEEFFGKPREKVVEKFKKRKEKERKERKERKEKKPVKEVEEDDEEDDEEGAAEETAADDATGAPTFESTTVTAKKSKIKKQTAELEAEVLAEKPWTMLGEVSATSRPMDSLLDAAPDFEQAGKIAPEITVQHTETIEEIIKRRIIKEDWDDVVPRELPSVGRKKREEAPEVSQEKSKIGLGEIYEREYLKKATGVDVDANEKLSESEIAKSEMRMLFAKLCSKLDALSNYHFAPRPIGEDESDVKNVSAIVMEEAQPLGVSTRDTSAPEEVFGVKRGRNSVLKGESEIEQGEKSARRNTKKKKRRTERAAKEADEKLISKLQPGLGLNNPYEKRKIREDLARARSGGKVVDSKMDANDDYNSSTKLFKRLEGEKAEKEGEGREAAEYGKTKTKKSGQLIM